MNEIAKLCEIAYIIGKLEGQNKIKESDFYDLEDMYLKVYKPIFEEWKNDNSETIFKNDEEKVYISAFSQRRILELFSK